MTGHPLTETDNGNLPLQPTPLIGRTRELLRVRQRLQREDVRLVTLTGTPGVGKTRLALAVAASLRSEFPDGVFFVDLSPISDPALVGTTIAHRIGLTDLGLLDAIDGMVERLRGHATLLVLDNFEQIVPAAPLLAELLRACARLKFLVTSRISLGLRWEHESPVPPLPLPDLNHLPSLDVLAETPPIALFARRAQCVNPSFELTKDNARAVAEICTRLDGLPLAIELAAARSKILTPRAMLARLGRRLDLLRGTAPDRPLRHRTLRGAISWSYEALSEDLKAVFRRLAVFVGGIPGPDAGQVVWGEEAGQGDILEHLSALVDQSLLYFEASPEGNAEVEPRFRMLETIHEYAQEWLDRAEEAETVRRRHLTYYLALAEKAEPELTGPDQAPWLDRLEREHDNLRAIIRRAIESRDGEVGLRVGGRIWRFWLIRGHVSEGRRWLETLLALEGPTTPRTRGRALLGLAYLIWDEGNSVAAQELIRTAQALLEECGDESGIAHCLNLLGNALRDVGQLAEAIAAYERSLALREKLGDVGWAAQSLNNLGNALRDQGDYARAITLYERSLAIRRTREDHLSVAESLNDLGRVLRLAGDDECAMARQQECLPIFERLGDRRGVALTNCELAALAHDRGDYVSATARAAKAGVLFREAGEHWGVALALLILGRCAARQDQAVRATRLLGAATRLLEGLNLGIPVTEREDLARVLEICSRTLDATTLISAWEAGRALSMTEAIGEAVGETSGEARGRTQPPRDDEAGPSGRFVAPPAIDPTSPAAAAAFVAPGGSSDGTAEAALTARGPEPSSRSTLPEADRCRLDRLSPREGDVVRCLVRGRTTKQIATDLIITEGTARLHIAHILNKLGFHSRAEIVAWAIRGGLDRAPEG